ncbi:MAG: type 3 dihydrofolate reductase [Betaproteobacteria bacterium]
MTKPTKSRISLIVAMAKNRVIGSNNQMPWHLPADFAYFKRITLGHPVIMGRKTFESIGKALPGRRNIVVSRNRDFHVNGGDLMHSLDDAIGSCKGSEEVFVIGGASLYADALPQADRLYITEVDVSPDGETLFPAIDTSNWLETARQRVETDAKNAYAMDFVVLERR